jgi:hypothetical protein
MQYAMRERYEYGAPRPAQLGFVPGRVITEASHLLKLTQAYLDETNEEGLILALDWDWEKAFDRASWNVESRVRA